MNTVLRTLNDRERPALVYASTVQFGRTFSGGLEVWNRLQIELAILAKHRGRGPIKKLSPHNHNQSIIHNVEYVYIHRVSVKWSSDIWSFCIIFGYMVNGQSDFITKFFGYMVFSALQSGCGGWPTGNGKKLSSCQSQLGQATCLAVA